MQISISDLCGYYFVCRQGTLYYLCEVTQVVFGGVEYAPSRYQTLGVLLNVPLLNL